MALSSITFFDVATTNTDGTEDDLYSDTLAASLFADNGDKIRVEYSLTFAASATATRRVQAYLGGTGILDSGALTFASGGAAFLRYTAIRESSSVLRVKAEFLVSGVSLQPIVTYTRITGLTLSAAQIAKVTGIAAGAGAAPGDITAVLGAGTYRKAA
jgi:hypothetical protein